MLVTILKAHDNFVTVSTPYGNFSGRWCAPSIPQKFKTYDVELDTSDIIDNIAVWKTETKAPSISCVDHEVYLTGLFECHEDRVLFVRLGDSLVMFETNEEFDILRFKGAYVCVKMSEIQLWDTGLLVHQY